MEQRAFARKKSVDDKRPKAIKIWSIVRASNVDEISEGKLRVELNNITHHLEKIVLYSSYAYFNGEVSIHKPFQFTTVRYY